MKFRNISHKDLRKKITLSYREQQENMSKNLSMQEIIDMSLILSEPQECWDEENKEIHAAIFEVTKQIYDDIYRYAKGDIRIRWEGNPQNKNPVYQKILKEFGCGEYYPDPDVVTEEQVDEMLAEFCFEITYKGITYYDANICNRFEKDGRYFIEIDFW